LHRAASEPEMLLGIVYGIGRPGTMTDSNRPEMILRSEALMLSKTMTRIHSGGSQKVQTKVPARNRCRGVDSKVMCSHYSIKENEPES
jgi:hypothetical protein